MRFLKAPIHSLRTLLSVAFRFVSRLFVTLRDLDVDAVGRLSFKHCTSPKALYVTLFERWWVVATCALLGMCLGCVLIKTAVKKFESHGKLLVYQKLPTFMDDSTRLPDPKAYDSLFATHVALIGSPLIVKRAVDSFDLVNRCPEIQTELEANRDYTHYIQNHLNVSRAGSGDAKGAFVISVGFDHISANECPIVVEAILETYREYVNHSMLDDQEKAVSLIGGIRKDLEAELKQKGDRYREFMRTADGVWNRDTENNMHQQRIETLELQLTELQLKEVAIASRIRIMAPTRDAKTGDKLTDLARLALIDETHITRLEMLQKIQGEGVAELYQMAYPERQEHANARYKKLNELFLERQTLLENLGSAHPKVTDLDAQIKMLESRLKNSKQEMAGGGASFDPADIVDAYIRMLNEELQDTQVRTAAVECSIAEELIAAKSLTDFTIKAKHLEDEYERAKEMYTTLIDKAQKQQVLSQFGSYVSEVIAYPHFKGQVTWPKKPVILGLCTILGIFLGSFLALALDLIAFTPLKQAFWFLPKWLVDVKSFGDFPMGSVSAAHPT